MMGDLDLVPWLRLLNDNGVDFILRVFDESDADPSRI